MGAGAGVCGTGVAAMNSAAEAVGATGGVGAAGINLLRNPPFFLRSLRRPLDRTRSLRWPLDRIGRSDVIGSSEEGVAACSLRKKLNGFTGGASAGGDRWNGSILGSTQRGHRGGIRRYVVGVK
eukprot:7877505-Pyramimonas_sp.AAC.1